MEKTFLVVDGELLQAVANYLGTRPYAEVANFVEALKPSPTITAEELRSIKPELFGEAQFAKETLEKVDKPKKVKK